MCAVNGKRCQVRVDVTNKTTELYYVRVWVAKPCGRLMYSVGAQEKPSSYRTTLFVSVTPIRKFTIPINYKRIRPFWLHTKNCSGKRHTRIWRNINAIGRAHFHNIIIRRCFVRLYNKRSTRRNHYTQSQRSRGGLNDDGSWRQGDRGVWKRMLWCEGNNSANNVLQHCCSCV